MVMASGDKATLRRPDFVLGGLILIPALVSSTERSTREVVETFELAGDQARVLQLAAEAWDMAQAASAEIAEEGITIRSATGAAKAHPAVATLNSAWDRFLKAVAMLGLNADELPVAIPEQRQHIRSVK
jgi:phage terminase small subunit